MSNNGSHIVEVYFSLTVKKLGTPSTVPRSRVLLSCLSVVISVRLLFHCPDGGSSLRRHNHIPAVERKGTKKEAPSPLKKLKKTFFIF